MAECVIEPGEHSAWYCVTHQCRMGGSMNLPPKSCLMGPLTRTTRMELQKERRRLQYRVLTGTLTKVDRERLADIKARLAE
jgi:hypothetical protein